MGVLAKLSSCTAASTHWRLNDCTIFIKHLMSELAHIFTKQTVLLLKVVTAILYLRQHLRFCYLLHMRRVVLKTCMDRYLVALEVLILTCPFIYTHFCSQ